MEHPRVKPGLSRLAFSKAVPRFDLSAQSGEDSRVAYSADENN